MQSQTDIFLDVFNFYVGRADIGNCFFYLEFFKSPINVIYVSVLSKKYVVAVTSCSLKTRITENKLKIKELKTSILKYTKCASFDTISQSAFSAFVCIWYFFFHRQSWASIDTVHDVNNMQSFIVLFHGGFNDPLCLPFKN